MKADPYDIKTVFNFERQLFAPLFQRPYVWNEEDQWEPLWQDVLRVANQLLAGNVNCKPHFLGAVVLDQLRVPIGKPDARSIIDGQQRLTTLQLLMEAVRDLGRNITEVDHERRQMERLLENQDVRDPDDRFKVWPTNVDRPVYRAIMETANPTELEKYILEKCDGKRSRLAEAYMYFHRVIGDWLNAEPSRFANLYRALVNTIREKLRLVVIDMDEHDDAQVIFETLNARGTPLLPSDLVKNYLFYHAFEKGEQVERLYASYWESFDVNDKFWREEVGVGRVKRARIDVFLHHFLSLKKRAEVPMGELFREYQHYAAELKDKTVEFQLDDFSRHAMIFKRMSELSDDSPEGVFFSRLSDMQTTTVYPLLLALYDAIPNQKDRMPLLATIESFLVRRMVCRLTTQGYNRLFLDMLASLAKQGVFSSDSVASYLLVQKADSTRWPDDIEVQESLLGQPLYTAITRPRLRFVLRAIDTAMHTKKTEDYVLKKGLTIEHLLPQHWEKHWALVQGERESDNDFEERKRNRSHVLQTIGNLTLLTNSLNPLVSNGTFKSKKKEILKHSAINLNRFLTDEDEWDEKHIRQRGEKLFKYFIKVWPYSPKTAAQ
ncbi:MAG: DUF262 domain-containing protein [Pirellula sp.]|jgi:hypothetical protein